ncbi:MAG: restriction endonuclease, partial [Candidatus Marinimicrobia bacterium]|nr:restriction endonuclease [Candidatus Neomarinimicrobiota bacterium]
MSSVSRHHAEWLSLVEVSGPFLSTPVLMRVFPQGLDTLDTEARRQLVGAYEEWLDEGRKKTLPHWAWIDYVLKNLLGFPEELLVEGQSMPPGMEAHMGVHGETLRPNYVLKHRDAGKPPVLLISVYPASQALEKPVAERTWKATPGTRMMELLHAADVQVGLVTNGEHWMLVYAPRGETTGFASWYADLWTQEPITLRAFVSLLHLRRFSGVAESDTLGAMLHASAKDQQEVTDQLGYQVRQAVEVLVQAIDRINEPGIRELLEAVDEKSIYDSALTVMMRLVFMFAAEERGMLLLGQNPMYDEYYALSTLRDELRERADQYGEEVLERRHDAWCRLLATFRAVHGGVEHESMRLPAYGGRLFDPDCYAFLEGRSQDTSWTDTRDRPLPINNRVVLHLLEALQLLRVKVSGGGPAEARRISFRALGIEQIGHVYEGLLDHTAKRATEVILGLKGGKDKEPEIPLSKLEELAGITAEGPLNFVREKGELLMAAERDNGPVLTGQRVTRAYGEPPPELIEFLKQETGRAENAIKKALSLRAEVDDHRICLACNQDARIEKRVQRFAGLLREDSFGQLVVIPAGSVYVTAGTDRRSTGTHYTPPSLTEPIVRHTLEPLVYVGPAEGKPENEWQLKSPKEILELKVCDMAMGSGAFLVQACRYLSERLAEAWEKLEKAHPGSVLATPEGGFSSGDTAERLIPSDLAERLAIARRYVADRCLYGVDINPMAVEMAKLSLWLTTLQRDRPFTFFDHALKCGDSLLGVTSVQQIENFSLRPGNRQITFATANLFRYVDEATAKRRALEALPSNDHTQIETKNRLNAEAEAATAKVKAI